MNAVEKTEVVKEILEVIESKDMSHTEIADVLVMAAVATLPKMLFTVAIEQKTP